MELKADAKSSQTAPYRRSSLSRSLRESDSRLETRTKKKFKIPPGAVIWVTLMSAPPPPEGAVLCGSLWPGKGGIFAREHNAVASQARLAHPIGAPGALALWQRPAGPVFLFRRETSHLDHPSMPMAERMRAAGQDEEEEENKKKKKKKKKKTRRPATRT